jgi:hypothetical protein
LNLLLEPYLQNVAAGVLENPNCTPTIFKAVAAKPIEEGWIPDPLLTLAPADMIEEIYGRVPESERFYVLKNPNASEALLIKVLADCSTIYDEGSIKSLLKRNNLPEEILLAAINKVAEHRLMPFAMYKFLTKRGVDTLIGFNSIDLTIELIANPSVTGAFLMPLAKNKSKKVQNALQRRTYSAFNVNREWSEVPYVGREELWAALPGGSSKIKYDVSLSFAAQPFEEDFDADSVSGWDSSQSMIGHGDSAYEAFPCLLGDFLDEFRDSPLGALLESDEDIEPDEQNVVALEVEASGFSIYKEIVTDEGGCSILYGKNTDVSIVVDAYSLGDAKKICVKNALKFLRVGDRANGEIFDIFQIFGTVRLDQDVLVASELWFTDDDTQKYIESWPG